MEQKHNKIVEIGKHRERYQIDLLSHMTRQAIGQLKRELNLSPEEVVAQLIEINADNQWEERFKEAKHELNRVWEVGHDLCHSTGSDISHPGELLLLMYPEIITTKYLEIKDPLVGFTIKRGYRLTQHGHTLTWEKPEI